MDVEFEREKLEKEVNELEEKEKPFFQRLKKELNEERNKPVKLSPLAILYIALIVGVVIAFIVLGFYIWRNINLLNTDPCSLCEKAGNICSRIGGS